MQLEVTRSVPADHPCLPGHFPTEPIVPGVVILDEVAAVLNEWKSGCRIVGVPTVKFLSLLRPAQSFTISISARDKSSGLVHFCCKAADRMIANGCLEIAGC